LEWRHGSGNRARLGELDLDRNRAIEGGMRDIALSWKERR
jgi:hypothetical protein